MVHNALIRNICNNANTAVRRELWEEMRYEEELTGLEDLDWAKWLLKKGYSLSCNAKAKIVHRHEAIACKETFGDQKMWIREFQRLLL